MFLPLVRHNSLFPASVLMSICAAVSLNHDVNTDKELVAHGYSNILAGALGTVSVLNSICVFRVLILLYLDQTTLYT